MQLSSVAKPTKLVKLSRVCIATDKAKKEFAQRTRALQKLEKLQKQIKK